jgi:PST family polysaccharide transporter
LIPARLGRWLDARQEQRKVIVNAFWLYVDKASRLVIALVVGLWVARHLGPGDFGDLNYAQAFVGLVGILVLFGLDTLTLRNLSERPQDERRILGTAFWLRIFSLSLGLTVSLGWVWWRGWDRQSSLVAVGSLSLLSSPMDALGLWFQSQRRSRESVLARNPSLWIAAGYRVVLILLNAPLWTFALAWSVETLLGALALALAYRRARGRGMSLSLDLEELKGYLGEFFPVLLAGFAAMVYLRIDMIMLPTLLPPGQGSVATGIYAAAVKLSEIWFSVPLAITGSAAPSIFESKLRDQALFESRFQRLTDFCTLTALGFGAFMAFTAPLTIRILYGQQYAGAAGILAVHAWSGIFVCFGVILNQWCNLHRRNGLLFAATAVGALVNVALNFLLIPAYRGLGSAWATLLSYAVMASVFPALVPSLRPVAKAQLRSLSLLVRPGRLISELRRKK